VSKITTKVISWFLWNLLIWLDLPVGRTDKLLMALIWSRVQMPDHFSTFLTIVDQEIVGDLLALLIYCHREIFITLGKNDWYRQGNESTTFWEQSADESGRHPNLNLDQSRNLDLNPGSLSVEVRRVDRGLLSLSTVYWQGCWPHYRISEGPYLVTISAKLMVTFARWSY